MYIKFIMITVTTTMMLSGLATAKPSKENPYGWKNLNPPRQNVLGKEVLKNGFIGDLIYSVNSETVDVSESLLSVTDVQYSNAAAGAEVLAEGMSAELGYNYSKSEKLSSGNWKISQIRNVSSQILLDRMFVYQCLTASQYEFMVSRKKGVNAAIDASEIAKKFGVDTAKVGLKSQPDKPDQFKVVVNNPNICLSYITAIFEENNGVWPNNVKDKFVDITGPYNVTGARKNKEKSYVLKPGDTSNPVFPIYMINPKPSTNPEYRLMAIQSDQEPVRLVACKDDKGIGKFKCDTEIADDGYGKWNRTYRIDTFAYGDQKYKVVNMKIDAKRDDNGSIHIDSAKLFSPQYKLVVK